MSASTLDLRRKSAGNEIGDGDALEDLPHADAERHPDRGQRARGAGVLELLGSEPTYARQRTLEGPNHIGHGDLIGRTGESEPPLLSTHAPDNAVALEIQEDVPHKGNRDVLGARHLVAGHGTSGRQLERGQLDQRTKRIVDLCGDAHLDVLHILVVGGSSRRDLRRVSERVRTSSDPDAETS